MVSGVDRHVLVAPSDLSLKLGLGLDLPHALGRVGASVALSETPSPVPEEGDPSLRHRFERKLQLP